MSLAYEKAYELRNDLSEWLEEVTGRLKRRDEAAAAARAIACLADAWHQADRLCQILASVSPPDTK